MTTPRRGRGGRPTMPTPRPAPESRYPPRRSRDGSNRGERGNSHDRSVFYLYFYIMSDKEKLSVCLSVSLGSNILFAVGASQKDGIDFPCKWRCDKERSLHESAIRIPLPVKW